MLIAKHHEKGSTIFTSNKIFFQWNEIFAEVTIASARPIGPDVFSP